MDEDCCTGHECDGCSMCRRGMCCRQDDPTYTLPGFMEWVGGVVGRPGVLDDDGERAMCHVCGGHYGHLGLHVRVAHDLTAPEYRSIFGLKASTKLIGPITKKRHQDAGTEHLRQYAEVGAEALRALTLEQRQQVSRRPLSYESKLEARADWILTCKACGSMFCRLPGTASWRRSTCSEECYNALASSTERGAIIRAARRRKRAPEECTECGAQFCSLDGNIKRKTCSDECRLASRRRHTAAASVSSRPEVRAAISQRRRARPYVHDEKGRFVKGQRYS